MIPTSGHTNSYSFFSPDQKSKLMNSIDSLSKKDHQVNGDYLSLALCTACIDISASTSNATILMGWEFKLYLAAKNLVPAKTVLVLFISTVQIWLHRLSIK